MRGSSVSKALLILGALVGGAAGVALALGLRLDQLPAWMITVGMYKLAFIAAGGLFVAGALLGRAARESSRRLTQNDEAAHRVSAGEWAEGERIPRQPDPVNRHRRDDRSTQ